MEKARVMLLLASHKRERRRTSDDKKEEEEEMSDTDIYFSHSLSTNLIYTTTTTQTLSLGSQHNQFLSFHLS